MCNHPSSSRNSEDKKIFAMLFALRKQAKSFVNVFHDDIIETPPIHLLCNPARLMGQLLFICSCKMQDTIFFSDNLSFIVSFTNA